MSPSPRTAALIAAVAVLALVVPVVVSVVLLAALVGVVAVDAAAANRTRPRVVRRAPAMLVRGVPAPLSAEATGAGSVLVRQAATPELEVEPRDGVGGLDATITPRRRGRHELPPLAVRSEGPLGLVRRFETAAPAQSVDVFPDVPGARRLALAVRHGRFREYAGRAPGPLGLGTDFESIRQYVPDDEVRQINWRATARTGRAMSNQYRVEQEREVVCLVDSGRLMTSPSGAPYGATRLDSALDAAVAVGLVADTLGDRFGAIAFDSELRAELRPRRRGGESVVRALFDLQPRGVDSDYELAMRRVSGAKRALVLVLTDLLDDVAARALVEAVPLLAKRHAVAVASVRDPDLDALLSQPPSQPLDVYAAVAALDVVAARDRAATLVRRAGADVIEAPPGSLPHECVRAYLRSKSRGRL